MKLDYKSIAINVINGFIKKLWKRRMNRNHFSIPYYIIVLYFI